jgi:hypothetical protein
MNGCIINSLEDILFLGSGSKHLNRQSLQV